MMKNLKSLIIILSCLLAFACKKDDKTERFIFLTTPVWTTESLLANGVDASGSGGILEQFKGDAKFNENGTGHFGSYTGSWRFNVDQTQLVIIADSLSLPIITDIVELNASSLKVTFLYPNSLDPPNPINIQITFKVK